MEQVKETSELIDSFIFDKEKMDLLMSEIAKNIVRERTKRNLSIHDLTDLTAVNYSHIYKIEKGKTTVGLQTLIKIAYVLNVSLDELVPFETRKRKTNGDIFDDITRNLDVASVNFLLDMARKYSEYKIKSLDVK